jgi:hypothetical protein
MNKKKTPAFGYVGAQLVFKKRRPNAANSNFLFMTYHFQTIQHAGPRDLPPTLFPLLEQERWVVWRWELNNQGKPTKVPSQARNPLSLKKAKSILPVRRSRPGSGAGLGFVRHSRINSRRHHRDKDYRRPDHLRGSSNGRLDIIKLTNGRLASEGDANQVMSRSKRTPKMMGVESICGPVTKTENSISIWQTPRTRSSRSRQKVGRSLRIQESCSSVPGEHYPWRDRNAEAASIGFDGIELLCRQQKIGGLNEPRRSRRTCHKLPE